MFKDIMDESNVGVSSKRPRLESCIALSDNIVEQRDQVRGLVEENGKLEERNKVLEAALQEVASMAKRGKEMNKVFEAESQELESRYDRDRN